jgi:hypothetical protein
VLSSLVNYPPIRQMTGMKVGQIALAVICLS